MTDLARWALLELGLVYLVTEAAITAPVRRPIAQLSWFFAGLLYCPACSGFWLGMLLGVLGFWPWPGLEWRGLFWGPLESAVAGMALGAIWATVHHNPAWGIEMRPSEGDDDAQDESEER